MKRFFHAASGLLAGALLAGCTMISELPASGRTVEPRSCEYIKARELLAAYLENDGEKFVSLLPEEMQKSFSVERFRATRDLLAVQFGEPKSFVYLASLEMPDYSPFVWKITFERRDQENKPQIRDALFRVVTAKSGDDAVIRGFQFL